MNLKNNISNLKLKIGTEQLYFDVDELIFLGLNFLNLCWTLLVGL